ncbi:MAG: sodium ion-translocating decarboxylase subunit beta [Clostridia bacterium]|nr:sodium ion-translocating decarboxylase subunit beta [Clostridia bacterium]
MGFTDADWKKYIMLIIAFVLMYLAIVRKFEPMLLLPIAFGMFLINIPGADDVLWGTYPVDEVTGEVSTAYEDVVDRGLLWYIYYGVDKVIYPPLIFLGIGAMTDFGPLISNPKSMLIGAGAQLGVFVAFILAILLGFSVAQAASIAIIGGADGPTAIYVTSQLSSDFLPAIAIAAYSYMALIPIIQKPLMKGLTTKKERTIRMKQTRQVSKIEKILFPLVVTLVVGLILPSSLPLLGMLMLGNLLRESGVVDRLSTQAQHGIMDTVTIFLGLAVGCKAKGDVFLTWQTLEIILIGLVAFMCATIGGLLTAKIMCAATHGKINPLIGSAGVSAVPMAARISEDVGRQYDPQNHLLMHAMGPNVAGVIGSAIAAGILLACFAGYADGTAATEATAQIMGIVAAI